jgi:digeranylgeranylglycerophospholipid reductase
MKTTIIGAGINGLYLARKLAKRGEEVTVFEKRNEIGKEACSGLFSERILDFIPESRPLIENEIKSVLIHLPKKTLKIDFSRKFFVMSHYELDNLAAGLAEKAGAKIVLGRSVEEPDFIGNEADRIIGCDGPLSTIRKKLNLAEPDYRLAIQGFVSEKDDSDFVETWPVKSGFIWKIPRKKEVAEASLHLPPHSASRSSVTEYGIIAKPSLAKDIFDGFLGENRISLSRTKSAVVPQGFCLPKNRRVTLCGDAAGLTKPWSGGGVIWGLTAADLLLKSFPDFLKYQKEAEKFFFPKILFSKIAVKMFYSFGINFSWLIPRNISLESDFLIRY